MVSFAFITKPINPKNKTPIFGKSLLFAYFIYLFYSILQNQIQKNIQIINEIFCRFRKLIYLCSETKK